MPSETSQIGKLKAYLLELAHLQSTISLLEWDQAVNMPTLHNGHMARSELLAYVAGLRHRKATSAELEDLLREAEKRIEAGSLNDDEQSVVKEALEDLERAKKCPPEFVEEQKRVESEAQRVWERAKKKSDFKIFEPYLARIVDLKRQESDYLREPSQSRYDALIDDYDPGYTTQKLEVIFTELKNFLIPFIQAINNSHVKHRLNIFKRPITVRQQLKLAKVVARKMGYDFNSGHLGTSVHPFSTSFHPTDARITVRYSRHNFINDCLMSMIHESGHAIYEQGLPTEYFGTPLAEAISCGIHESQSRLWENLIGRSLVFWRYFFPKLQKIMPEFGNVSLTDFYGAINSVQPSLIRIDADEVTYNLHIILRFEIEKALIGGQIEVKDVPELWNQKVKDYFGLDVGNDSDGVLQDMHWSDGSFGYFPSYALGNLYAAQFYKAAVRDIPNLEESMAKGNFRDLLKWLRRNIHIRGKKYSAEEILLRATGYNFTAVYFIEYLKDKYSGLYNL